MGIQTCQQCSSLRLETQCHLKYLGPVVQKKIMANLNWSGGV